jgi:FdhD protein
MSKASVAHSRITKIQSETIADADDLLAVEEPLEIRIGYGQAGSRQQKSISVTMRTPGHDFELALGFLFTEGIIADKNDITQIKYCTEVNTLENQENIVRAELKEQVEIDFSKLERNFYTTSSCGVCGKASIDAVRTECRIPLQVDKIRISRELIYSLPDSLRKHQDVFAYTGGLHASALFDTDGKLLITREDVGRHNALDKLIGAALAENRIPLNRHILLLSGRASFELIQKAAMAGIRVVCAVGAPSSLAVQMAEEFDISLIGFLRDQRFNIYTGGKRIIQ